MITSSAATTLLLLFQDSIPACTFLVDITTRDCCRNGISIYVYIPLQATQICTLKYVYLHICMYIILLVCSCMKTGESHVQSCSYNHLQFNYEILKVFQLLRICLRHPYWLTTFEMPQRNSNFALTSCETKLNEKKKTKIFFVPILKNSASTPAKSYAS